VFICLKFQSHFSWGAQILLSKCLKFHCPQQIPLTNFDSKLDLLSLHLQYVFPQTPKSHFYLKTCLALSKPHLRRIFTKLELALCTKKTTKTYKIISDLHQLLDHPQSAIFNLILSGFTIMLLENYLVEVRGPLLVAILLSMATLTKVVFLYLNEFAP
jgi:hypothetical protein